jgi:hypothetical protein
MALPHMCDADIPAEVGPCASLSAQNKIVSGPELEMAGFDKSQLVEERCVVTAGASRNLSN